ncbi:N-acetyltransferase, partial [Streptomyces sp. OR43]
DGVTLLVLDTESGSPAEWLYRSAGWTECGSVPDYAADPAGVLKPTTFYYKAVGRDGSGSVQAVSPSTSL